MMRFLMLPIAATIGFGLGATPSAASAAGYELPVLERAEIAGSGALGGIAKLRGLDVTFDFHSSGNTVGYSWQCEGLKYPGGAWPAFCRVGLSGPAIEERYGALGGRRVECNPDCQLVDIWMDPITIPVASAPAIAVTSLVVPRGGCFIRMRGGGLAANPACVAVLDAVPGQLFGFALSETHSFAMTSDCARAGVEFPASPWPAGCIISPRWLDMPKGPAGGGDELECSPKCEFRSQRQR